MKNEQNESMLDMMKIVMVFSMLITVALTIKFISMYDSFRQITQNCAQLKHLIDVQIQLSANLHTLMRLHHERLENMEFMANHMSTVLRLICENNGWSLEHLPSTSSDQFGTQILRGNDNPIDLQVLSNV